MIPSVAIQPAPLQATPLAILHPATRLGGLGLGLLATQQCGTLGLVLLAMGLAAILTWTGLTVSAQLQRLKAWTVVAILVLATHTVTTTAAAPLGHPSWFGLYKGTHALLRVVCSLGWLALYIRSTPLPDLVLGVRWWLWPLSRLGVRTEDLGLVLAVAMGTAPQVLAEGRRIEIATRLRRAGPQDTPRPGRFQRWLRRLQDRGLLLVPLMETLARRAESLTLSLRTRRPTSALPGRLPALEAFVILVWAAALVFRQTSFSTGGIW